MPRQTVPIVVEVDALIQAPPPPGVGCHPEDRAIAVPGARHVAARLSPVSLQQDQHRDALTIHHGFSVRVRGVGLVGPLLKQLDRLAIRPDPLPRHPIRLGPGAREIGRRRREILLRSPKKCEGILIVGDAEGAERRDIERVSDVREPVQARQPPDCEGRSGDCKADRQDERDAPELTESPAEQLTQLRRRTAHRHRCGALGLGQHERVGSRRMKISSLTSTPSYHNVSPLQRQLSENWETGTTAITQVAGASSGSQAAGGGFSPGPSWSTEDQRRRRRETVSGQRSRQTVGSCPPSIVGPSRALVRRIDRNRGQAEGALDLLGGHRESAQGALIEAGDSSERLASGFQEAADIVLLGE